MAKVEDIASFSGVDVSLAKKKKKKRQQMVFSLLAILSPDKCSGFGLL